jgi:hypothetical protein
MTYFEETRRIGCQNASGRPLVIIEQRKWAVGKTTGNAKAPVYDYMTEDGEIASKLDDETFLLLMTDEVFHRA